MTRNLLIDMIKLRSVLVEDPSVRLPEGYFNQPAGREGLKSVRELAAFRFTCRKCEDAPCISVCPADALEKDNEGIINRHTNLCIACKSCVAICPFGTMMTDFFIHHRNKDLFYDLNDDAQIESFIAAFPGGIVSFTEEDEAPEKNIYRLNEKVLIREYLYTTEKQ
jgi:Fe-S-cluster-containing dehydrogenase component